MEQVEQAFPNVPLSRLELIFKRWIKEAQTEIQPTKVEPTDQPEQVFQCAFIKVGANFQT